jgi:protein-S-isoprenylcysteine O-methyltransferase Ste14
MSGNSVVPSAPARAGYLAYGLVCYAVFFATILYAIGFVGNFWPVLGLDQVALFRSMDVGDPGTSLGEALLIDTLLLGLFALQHSGMARPGFKRWWTRTVPAAAERSTYVLAASLCLDTLFSQWRPLGTTQLWQVSNSGATTAVVISLAGWAIVFAATFMIDHFDLFGLRQSWYGFRGKPYPEQKFATPGFYRAVRHPIYLGFVIAFWATPTMTLGHFVFAAMTTVYILIAIQLEERDLTDRYGAQYDDYRRRVGMLLPMPPTAAKARSDAPIARPR